MKIERNFYSYEMDLTEDDCVRIRQSDAYEQQDAIILIHISQLALFVQDINSFLVAAKSDGLLTMQYGSNP